MEIEVGHPSDRRGIGRLAARIPADLRLFLAGMAALIPLRIAHAVQVGSMWVDGGYYLEVAQHVRDGDGLVSDLSLYNFGYPSFPHPTSIYPLWPVLLGLSGRLVDIEILAHWLPLGLSFLAIGAAFLFGRQLWPEPVLPRWIPGLHAGHVFAAGLAVNADFVYFAPLPYTEPLAWTLLFLLCWRAVQKGPDLGLAWAIETGLWLALSYLARFQLLVVLLAMASAYAVRLLLGPDRGRLLGHAAVALGIPLATIGAWFLWIRTFVDGAGPSSLLRFDQNRANQLLQPIDVIVETPGPLALLLDRAQGFLVAWAPLSDDGYGASYFTLHWALPLALPFLLAAGVRALRREGAAALLERARRPEAAHWPFVALLALGALLSVHAIHKHYNGAWYFSSRQGLMSLPAFVLPLAWLLRQRRPLPVLLGVAVLGSSLAVGASRAFRYAAHAPRELEGDRYALASWLERRAPPGQRLVVAMDSAVVQRIAWQTEGVGYHWVTAQTSYQDYLTMTDVLGARYVILRKKALGRRWKLHEDPERLGRDFVRLPDPPGSLVVFERRR